MQKIQNNYKPYQHVIDLINDASDMEIESLALEICLRAFAVEDVHIMDTYIELMSTCNTDRQKNIIARLQTDYPDVESALERLGHLCDELEDMADRAADMRKSISN